MGENDLKELPLLLVTPDMVFPQEPNYLAHTDLHPCLTRLLFVLFALVSSRDFLDAVYLSSKLSPQVFTFVCYFSFFLEHCSWNHFHLVSVLLFFCNFILVPRASQESDQR